MTQRWEDRGRMLMIAADIRRIADRFDALAPERSRNPYTGVWELRPGLTAAIRDHANWLEDRAVAMGDEEFETSVCQGGGTS